MDFWNYLCEAKASVFTDEMDLCFKSGKPPDGSNQNTLCYGFGGSRMMTGTRMEISGVVIPNSLERPSLSNSDLDTMLDEEVNIAKKYSNYPPCSLFSPGESKSGFSYESLMRTQKSSAVNLTLGKMTDWKNDESPGDGGHQPRRPQTTAFCTQGALLCQVYGCNSDLTTSKEYHKRHRVCDIHSKSPTVIVNGTNQRFCQQCSRFHLLSEFDKSKRSCRRRLAGHNERRRKPRYRLTDEHSCRDEEVDVKAKGCESGLAGSSRSSFPLLESCLYVQTSSEGYCARPPSVATKGNGFWTSPGLCCSSCAPSLLSVESHESPLHCNPGIQHSRIRTNQRHAAHRTYLIKSMDINEMAFLARSTASWAGYKGSLNRSGFLDSEYCVAPPERKSTIDLLQLSIHLQRVEMEQNKRLRFS